MNNTIAPSFLTDSDFSCIWTDDEDCSDADPVSDHAAFVAYLHSEWEELFEATPIVWLADRESDRRVTR